MGSIFNLNKFAHAYDMMDNTQLKAEFDRVKTNPKSPEFASLFEAIAKKAYTGRGDRSLQSLAEKMTSLLASQSTEAEIKEYESEQVNAIKSTRHEGLEILNKINLEAYKIVNENINRITSLDKSLKEKCNLDFLKRFLSNYNTDPNIDQGCKKNIGQYFLDRFSNTELRKNLFTKYDFFGYNPSILKYYATIAYFQDSDFIKKIHPNLHDAFDGHLNSAGINWQNGRDVISESELHENMSKRDFNFAIHSPTRGMPLLGKKIIINDSGDSSFAIMVILNNFYNALQNRDESAICFVLNQFMEKVRYSIKSEEYKIDPNKICGASEAGINFVNRTDFYVERNSINIIKNKIDELYKFYDFLNRLSDDFSGPAQTYARAIVNGLNECLENARTFINNLSEWQSFQQQMYANQEQSLNYLDIIVNKHINSRNPLQTRIAIEKGSFAPFEFVSTQGVSVKIYFKSTGNSVSPVYEYYSDNNETNGSEFKQLSLKTELTFSSADIKLPESFAAKITTPEESVSGQDVEMKLADLCSIVRSIPNVERIGLRNLEKHALFSLKLKNSNGYYALDEQKSSNLFSDEEQAYRIPEIVEGIKDYISTNISEIIKIADHFNKQKIPLPPIPVIDGGEDLSEISDNFDSENHESISAYFDKVINSSSHSKYPLRVLQHFYPHQGIVMHQILLAIENEYRSSIADLNKDLGLTDDALECYESVGRMAISSKLMELRSSLNQIQPQDPRKKEIESYILSLEKISKKMDTIFRGDKGEGLDQTNWSSAGTSFEKVRGTRYQVTGGKRSYINYVFPRWLSKAISLDETAQKGFDGSEKENVGINDNIIVHKNKIQSIIKNYLNTLEDDRILDIGAMLKIINGLDRPDSVPECNLGIAQNYAGSEIGKAVKKAIDAKKVSENDAETISKIFAKLSSGDGLAYLTAIGKKDRGRDIANSTSYSVGAEVVKSSYCTENNVKISTQNVNINFIDYSINDWTKFIARRIYLGG